MLDVRLLGPMQLIHRGALLPELRSTRLEALLGFLILHRDRPASREQIAPLFWPDSPEAQARRNLRKSLHELREQLPFIEEFVRLEGNLVQWRADAASTIDLDELERAAAGGPSQGPLPRILDLYRGDLLPRCRDPWLLWHRERARSLYVQLLENTLEIQERAGGLEAAFTVAERMLELDRTGEAAWRHLIRLKCLMEDRAGATRLYHLCVATLRKELDVEPGRETRELYARLMQRAPMVAIPRSEAVPRVGRDAEWKILRLEWQRLQPGRSLAVALVGAAGIGKSYLAGELAAWVARQGQRTLSARCYPAEQGLAYAAVRGLLKSRPLPPLDPVWRQELVRVMPEMLAEEPGLAPPGPLVEPWQRWRLFEALRRAMAGPGPMLLLIDDLQWCDRESIEWIGHLLNDPGSSPVMMVCSIRPAELGLSPFAESVLRTLKARDRLVRIDLTPLSRDETAQLAAQIAGHDLASGEVDRLFGETEGNPLFIREMLRAGMWSDEGSRGLSPTIREVILEQVARLSGRAERLAGVAAVIGRSFSFAVLAEVSDELEPEVLAGLDELRDRGLVRELRAGAYDFSHGKVQEVIYHALSLTRRHQLHRRVAEAIEAHAGDQLDALSGEVAGHHEQAGLMDRAAASYLRAGGWAGRVGAHEQALTFYERAADRIDPDQHPQRWWQALCGQDDVLEIFGRRDDRARLQARMQRHLEAHPDGHRRAVLLSRQACLQVRLAAYLEAVELARAAREAALGVDDLHTAAVACLDLGYCLYTLNRHDEAAAAFEEALALAREVKAVVQEARSLFRLSYVYRTRLQPDRALDLATTAMRVIRLAHDTNLEIDGLSILSHCLDDVGRVSEALEIAEHLYTLVVNSSDRVRLMVTQTHLSRFHFRLGHFSQAMELHRTSLELARECRDLHAEPVIRVRMAEALIHLGRYAEAGDCLGNPIELMRPFRKDAFHLSLRSTIAFEEGRLEEARELARIALQKALDRQEPHHELMPRQSLARALTSLHQPDEAVAVLQRALDLLRSHSDFGRIGQLECLTAEAHLAAGRVQEALDRLAGVIEGLEAGREGLVVPQWPYLVYAEALRRAGHGREAQAAILRARDHLERLEKGITTEAEREVYRREVSINRRLLSCLNDSFSKA